MIRLELFKFQHARDWIISQTRSIIYSSRQQCDLSSHRASVARKFSRSQWPLDLSRRRRCERPFALPHCPPFLSLISQCSYHAGDFPSRFDRTIPKQNSDNRQRGNIVLIHERNASLFAYIRLYKSTASLIFCTIFKNEPIFEITSNGHDKRK